MSATCYFILLFFSGYICFYKIHQRGIAVNVPGDDVSRNGSKCRGNKFIDRYAYIKAFAIPVPGLHDENRRIQGYDMLKNEAAILAGYCIQ